MPLSNTAHKASWLGVHERLTAQKDWFWPPADVDFFRHLIAARFAQDFTSRTALRNPLSHYCDINGTSNHSCSAVDTGVWPHEHLLNDAIFALFVAVRLLWLASFRLAGGSTDS